MKILEFVEGEHVTYTFTTLRDGAVVNLTGYTIVLSMRDESVATNRVSSSSCTIASAAAGTFTFLFTATILTFAGTDTDAKGSVTITFIVGSVIEKCVIPYRIRRDPCTV